MHYQMYSTDFFQGLTLESRFTNVTEIILLNSFRHHTNDLLMDSSKASYDSEYDWTTDNLINDHV